MAGLLQVSRSIAVGESNSHNRFDSRGSLGIVGDVKLVQTGDSWEPVALAGHVRFWEGAEHQLSTVEILRHRRETRRQTEKTNTILTLIESRLLARSGGKHESEMKVVLPPPGQRNRWPTKIFAMMLR